MEPTNRPGCPAVRTESFEATTASGETVDITRCIDCSASIVVYRPKDSTGMLVTDE